MSIGKNCAFFAGGMIAGAALLGVQSVRWMRKNEAIMNTVKAEAEDAVRRKAAEVLYPQRRTEYKAYHDESNDITWLQGDSFRCCFHSLSDARAFREVAMDCVTRYGYVTVAYIYDMLDLDTTYTMNKYGWDDIRDFTIKSTFYKGNVDFSYYIQLPVPKEI